MKVKQSQKVCVLLAKLLSLLSRVGRWLLVCRRTAATCQDDVHTSVGLTCQTCCGPHPSRARLAVFTIVRCEHHVPLAVEVLIALVKHHAVTRQTCCDNIARVCEMDRRLLQKQTVERYQRGNWSR